MSPLISDLALILICVGSMTLLFKWLGQPLVLGYIVAGFIASPHLSFTPSVIDAESIHTWADLGVIFLLFALGLEFSVKKIVKVGSTAIIAALTIIFGMIGLGICVGSLFGWSHMDCLFLGGMIAMSSTTIIYKAFSDLGLSARPFAHLVLSILILEDVLAIVLMVVLSTVAVTGRFQGMDLILGILKMGFFLMLWFLVGIGLVPALLRRLKGLMNNETLLIVALALCFGMVVVADSTGFSPAFGAFIMGSILAETIEAEKIEHLVAPVKDLFGAIFFVSVGMMVNPAMIVQYALPITVLVLTILFGQTTFGTLGVLLSGRPLKIAVPCGFSLAQIGEFAFIIASLGVSLGVTSSFLYPVVVAVSVITTFFTPYMIRLSEPVTTALNNILPEKWQRMLNRDSEHSRTVEGDKRWHELAWRMIRTTMIYFCVCLAVLFIIARFLSPAIKSVLPGIWGACAVAALSVLCISPFLRAFIVKGNGSEEFHSLWNEGWGHRARLVATIVLRALLAVTLVEVVLTWQLEDVPAMLLGVMSIVFVFAIMSSKRLKRHSRRIEQSWLRNLDERDRHAEHLGQKNPEYEGRLLSHDLHLAHFDLPATSLWSGQTLATLGLGRKYGIHVVSVVREGCRRNIPGGAMQVFPGDRLQVIGNEEQLARFGEAVNASVAPSLGGMHHDDPTLKLLTLTATSPFVGRTIIDCRSREDYNCLIVGVEREGEALHAPLPSEEFRPDDTVWLVGEPSDIYRLADIK